MLAEILKENKVDNSGMRFDPAARTALAFVTLRSDGEREFMFFRNPSADMLLRKSELDINLIKKVCFVQFFSVMDLMPIVEMFNIQLADMQSRQQSSIMVR